MCQSLMPNQVRRFASGKRDRNEKSFGDELLILATKLLFDSLEGGDGGGQFSPQTLNAGQTTFVLSKKMRPFLLACPAVKFD